MSPAGMNQFVLGALAMAFLIVSRFFGRFYTRTKDRFFAFLSAAFAIMSVNQFALLVYGEISEYRSWLHLVRLLAFVLILIGIWDKNR